MHLSTQGTNAVDVMPEALDRAWAILKALGQTFDDETLTLIITGETALNLIYSAMDNIAIAAKAAKEVTRTWKPDGPQTSMQHSWSADSA